MQLVMDYYNHCYGLLQSVQCCCPEEIGTTTKSFNFLHLGIQEYFATKYVATLPENEVHAFLAESFLISDDHLDSKCARLSNVWIIYCGISSNWLRHYMAIREPPHLFQNANYTMPGFVLVTITKK